MRVAVLIKQVPNPDALGAVMRVDEVARAVALPPGHPLVVSPFDEQALEAALRIRDQLGAEVRITAITLGPESARAAIRHALSLGADDAVHLLDPAFDDADGHVTAHALAAAIRQLGSIDLVLVRNDEVVIIDFKTDPPPPDGTSASAYPAYRRQLELYGEALERGDLVGGRTMRLGLLFTGNGEVAWAA